MGSTILPGSEERSVSVGFWIWLGSWSSLQVVRSWLGVDAQKQELDGPLAAQVSRNTRKRLFEQPEIYVRRKALDRTPRRWLSCSGMQSVQIRARVSSSKYCHVN